MQRHSAFVLPLILIFLLIAGALIAVSLDLATNSQNQAMNMVTTGTLYNAAQSGIEWAKGELLEHRTDLDWTPSEEYNGDISVLYATYDDDGDTGTPGTQVWNDEASTDLNDRYENDHIHVDVEILNCNYTVSDPAGITAADKLPPIIPPASGGSNPGETATMNFTNGTTVIMDPYRVTSSGGGSTTGHYFIIRATATETGNSNRTKTLETMVVIQG